jgi:pimeloyl-ACP methyl ester carboxylesterase
MLLSHHPAILNQPEVQAFIDRTYPALRATPARSFEYALRAFTTFDLRPFMNEVEQPTLIICGQADKQIPPEDSQILAEGLPNAHLEWLKAVGHNPFVESPNRCLTLIQNFANGAGR